MFPSGTIYRTIAGSIGENLNDSGPDGNADPGADGAVGDEDEDDEWLPQAMANTPTAMKTARLMHR